MVSSIDKKYRKKLTGVSILPIRHFEDNRIPEPEDIRRWDDLKDLRTADQVDVTKVLLMISLHHSEVHFPQAAYMKPGEPNIFTMKSVIGMILKGGEKDHHAADQLRASVNFVQTRSIDDKLNEWLNYDIDRQYDGSRKPSFNERRAKETMEEGIRFVDVHFEVTIPWKNDPVVMPDNYAKVLSCLERKRNKFMKDKKHFEEYSSAIAKYVQEGFAERVPEAELNSIPIFFLPHHAVAVLSA